MCPDYYSLRAKLEAIYRRAEVTYSGPAGDVELDTMALKEIRLKMSAHIKSCQVCQENIRMAKGES